MLFTYCDFFFFLIYCPLLDWFSSLFSFYCFERLLFYFSNSYFYILNINLNFKIFLSFFLLVSLYISTLFAPYHTVFSSIQFSSVTHSCPTLCDPMNHSTPGLPVHHQLPWVHSNSCPLSRWCHPTISSSVIPFSSCPQSFPASGSFQISQLFASGGQRIRVSASASALPMNTQDRSPLGWTGWISLQSKGLPRVFSNTTLQKHQFFSAQLSL